jgi:hypothetical protein
MTLTSIIFNIQGIGYTSQLSIEQITSKIESICKVKSSGISGRFTENTEFTVFDTMNVIGWSMPNLKRKLAYAFGNLTPNSKGTTISLRIKPNSMLPLFAIVAMLGGSIFTLVVLSMSNESTYYLVFGIGLLVLGIAYYPISTWLSNRLRNRIEKYLELTQI